MNQRRINNILNPELKGIPERDYIEEINIRTHRAGHTTRDGKPIPPRIMSRVPFGKTKLNVWPRDENGHLIE